jgi:hypothetical protein
MPAAASFAVISVPMLSRQSWIRRVGSRKRDPQASMAAFFAICD